MAFHGEVLVPCGRAAVHRLAPDMLVFMRQDPAAEGRGRDNFLARDNVGVLCPCPGWDAEGHIDASDLKYLQGRTGVLGSFPEHPHALAPLMAI